MTDSKNRPLAIDQWLASLPDGSQVGGVIGAHLGKLGREMGTPALEYDPEADRRADEDLRDARAPSQVCRLEEKP